MHSFPQRLLLALLLCAVATQAVAAGPKSDGDYDAADLPKPARRTVQFVADVHPILARHCISCHGPDKQKGGLRLDSRDAALTGGSSYGPAIVPGKSADSPLVQFMAHLESGMEMPPDEERLPDQSIALVRAWIDQGAKWPSRPGGRAAEHMALGNQELIFKKAAMHWSLQPLRKVDPRTFGAGPVTIDGFIADKLRNEGLNRSEPADARTLLRRLHFDLTGLPPTVEEMSSFQSDFARDRRNSVAMKVDELLASPHFGERWGRFWLDLARYADTQDFSPQPDLRYPYAWTYRDYVIGAFNADKPYDQFIREQIAADQLGLPAADPTLAALGYLTVGPRFLRRTDEVINDRIDVVTRGLMGLTVACARCHDHKYDPIRTADFYALYGVFSSTEDLVELPEIALASTQLDAKARANYEAARSKAQQTLTDFKQHLKDKAVADILAKPEVYFDAVCQIEVKKSSNVRALISGKKMLETTLTPLAQQYVASRSPGKWWQDPVLGPLARVAGASPDRKAKVLADIVKSGLLPERRPVHPVVLAALRSEKPTDDEALLRLYGELLAKAQQSPDAEQKELVQAFSGPEGWLDFDMKNVEKAYRLLAAGRKELDKLEAAVPELEATHPGAPARAMAVRDKPKPMEPVIFIRGERERKGDRVDRRFLEVLDPRKKPFPADHSGRRELAEQIVSPANPLTPRVWANHVWRHLMGHSLVKTPGDFGLQAEPPSHGELLDWLAAALIEGGWSTKRLVRDIVLSDTYQQSSVDCPAARAVDPENDLLWRAQCRRMDFEAMRDAMLAASGQLDPAVGGRAVNLSTEPFTGRRTVYGFVDRANPDPLFTMFDFPSTDIAAPERSQTQVPQQALFALNDGFIISQARALAARARQAAGGHASADPGSTIRWLYARAFQRQPTDAEIALARHFLNETSKLSPETSSGPWQYGVGSANPVVPRSTAFQPLVYFDPQLRRYQGGRVFPHPEFGFASVIAAGGHPGLGIGMASIRRWIAPYDGEFSIKGELSVPRQNKGDGVRGRVVSSRSGVLAEWIADRTAPRTELERVGLKAGEILDFTVDCRRSANSDGFRWVPTIHLLIRPEDAPADIQTVWDAQADFKPPSPPKLEPLEQVGHALLMTNEFLFIN
jgi:mono/diheme cytochrome c family protein